MIHRQRTTFERSRQLQIMNFLEIFMTNRLKFSRENMEEIYVVVMQRRLSNELIDSIDWEKIFDISVQRSKPTNVYPVHLLNIPIRNRPSNRWNLVWDCRKISIIIWIYRRLISNILLNQINIKKISRQRLANVFVLLRINRRKSSPNLWIISVILSMVKWMNIRD